VTAAEWEITPRQTTVAGTVAEVWRHRALLGFIGTRALQKMYRRTVLGWLWLLINPLFPLVLRAIIFGGLIGVGAQGLPYFLFLVAGSLVWDTFSASLMWGTRSLEMNRHLVDQMYLPRALLPFGNTAPALFDFAVKLAVLALAVAYYSAADGRVYVSGGVPLLWAAAALLLAFALSTALSLFTSVWGESTRDMRFTLGQLLSVWYLLTPVLYPLAEVPEPYRAWMLLNPMATIVETFKWGLFGIGEFRPAAFAATALGVLVLTIVGLTYFTRTDAQAIEER
jgi:lipopolysaccharide transport system permease protein